MSSQHFTLQKQKNESGTIIKPDVSRISNVDPSMGLELRAVDPHGEMDKKASPRIDNSNTRPWENHSPKEFTSLSCQKINRFQRQ